MFDFFVELFGESKESFYRYQVDNGKKIAVQGYKNILLVNDEQILLKLKKSELSIAGKNLKLKELGTNTVIIFGDIKVVSEDLKDNGK